MFQVYPEHTVQSWVVTRDTAGWLQFVSDVFDAEDLGRVPTEDGGIGHAEVRIGASVLLAFDSQPDWIPTPALLRVFVDDADATTERAVAAGATLVTPVSDDPWGHRGGRVQDPFGTIWWVVQHLEDPDWETISRRLQEPEHLERMAQGQSTLDDALGTASSSWSSRPVVGTPPTDT